MSVLENQDFRVCPIPRPDFVSMPPGLWQPYLRPVVYFREWNNKHGANAVVLFAGKADEDVS